MESFKRTGGMYDLLPRFVSEPVEYIDGKHLRHITRDFEWNGRSFIFVISPALVRNQSGEEKHYFPGKLEEFIETVLRGLALPENPNFLLKELILHFSFKQLLEEVTNLTSGLNYTTIDIELGLKILVDTRYELISKTTGAELYFRPIERLTMREINDEVYYRAQLSPLLFNKDDQFDFCFSRKNRLDQI